MFFRICIFKALTKIYDTFYRSTAVFHAFTLVNAFYPLAFSLRFIPGRIYGFNFT
jgi:hypothetical protein